MADVFVPENVNLDKIIALCWEKKVDLLFICIPCTENYCINPTLNCFAQYLADNGVDYINLSRDEDFLNYACDFADTSHVNVAGSHKLTTFIGKYFDEKYQRVVVDEKVKAEWDKVLDVYNPEKDQLILSVSDDPVYVMNMTYADNNYDVSIVGNAELFERYQVNDFYPDAVSNEEYNYLEIVVYHKNDKEQLAIVKNTYNTYFFMGK